MTAATTLVDLRTELLDIAGRWARSQYRLCQLAAEIDRSQAWAAAGATSAGAWIAALLDIEPGTAREWVRIGWALQHLPAIDTAFATGRLSFTKVRVLTRIAEPGTETELVALADTTPAAQLQRVIAAWRSGRETPEDTEARQHRDRTFSTWVDADGMVCGHFRLEPLPGGALVAAVETDLIRHHRDATAVASPPLHSQRADALTRLLDTGGTATFEVILHVRADGCTLHDGTPIAGTVAERVAPAAFLRVLIHDAHNHPINASGRHRHPTTRQKRVIDERQPACPHCGTRSLLQYHHQPPYEHTHRTVIDELQHPCAPCHRQHHHD